MAVFIGSTKGVSPLKIQKMRDALKDIYDVLEQNTSLDPSGINRNTIGSLLFEYRDLKNAIPYTGQPEVMFYGGDEENNLRVGKEKVNQPLFFAANALNRAYFLPSVARKVLEALISNKPSVYKRK